MMIDFAIIGGTGLNQLFGLEGYQEKHIDTLFGKPSAPIQIAAMGGEKGDRGETQVAFLARHGQPHCLPPHRVNYRANIMALKDLGVKAIIAVNAVGGIASSMTLAPHLVIPDQVIDYTYSREQTFYDGEGVPGFDRVEHIDFTHPFDRALREKLIAETQKSQLPFSLSGVYGCTQGPRLETPTEIKRMAQDGCDIVGMTLMPEAALARELAIPYASICLVVNPAAGLSSCEITMAEIQKAIDLGMSEVVNIVRRVILL